MLPLIVPQAENIEGEKRDMGMKIAVCDDDALFLQELGDCLTQYSEGQESKIEYLAFENPLELVAELEKGVSFDVIFLDVFMPGINGIQCARDIRSYDNYVKIIFLTSSSEFAVESYEVRAYHYLLKPLQKEKLFGILKQIEEEEKREEELISIFKCKSGIVKVSLSKLEYCEIINRKVLLHLVNGEEYECNIRINELEKRLENYKMFIKAHRSFLVNMDYIHTLTTSNLVMQCGAVIPIPREKYARIKNVYMEYVFQNFHKVIYGTVEG